MVKENDSPIGRGRESEGDIESVIGKTLYEGERACIFKLKVSIMVLRLKSSVWFYLREYVRHFKQKSHHIQGSFFSVAQLDLQSNRPAEYLPNTNRMSSLLSLHNDCSSSIRIVPISSSLRKRKDWSNKHTNPTYRECNDLLCGVVLYIIKHTHTHIQLIELHTHTLSF